MDKAVSLELGLERDWLTWLALNHHLPPKLIASFLHAVLRDVDSGQYKLEDMFELVELDGPAGLDGIVIRPTERGPSGSAQLAMLFRTLLWKSDQAHHLDVSVQVAGQNVNLADVAQFAEHDLSSLNDFLETGPFQAGGVLGRLSALTNAAELAIENRGAPVEGYWAQVESSLSSLDLPLRGVAIKHFGDLVADADDWRRAEHGYQLAMQIFQRWQPGPNALWLARRQWSESCAMSLASAAGMRCGNREAQDRLAAHVALPLAEGGLATVNSSVEAAYYGAKVDAFRWSDRRPSVYWAPGLYSAAGIEAALVDSSAGRFDDAHRRFWAVLRRQVQAGLGTQARRTKALYAESLFASQTTRPSRDAFELAVRLLIESGRSNRLTKLNFDRRFVEEYVDESLWSMVEERTSTHAGARQERLRVAVEMAAAWVGMLPPGAASLVARMWRFVARVAEEFSAELVDSDNLGGVALDALGMMAEVRPEGRADAGPAVMDAVVSRLRDTGFWTNRSKAIAVATGYVDVLQLEQREGLSEEVLRLLEDTVPSDRTPPVERSALSLLCDPRMREALERRGLEERTLTQVVRIGAANSSRASDVFYLLAGFKPEAFKQPAVLQVLQQPIVEARNRLAHLNSSDLVNNILALLIAPAAVGREGLVAALGAFSSLVQSVSNQDTSLSFPHGFRVLLWLSEHWESIGRYLASGELEKWGAQLGADLVGLWDNAVQRPLMFRVFALPVHTEPSHAVVHNWAVSSLRFAHAVGCSAEVAAAVERAALNEQLTAAIRQGQANVDLRLDTTRTDSQITPSIVANIQQVTRASVYYRLVGSALALLAAKADENFKRRLCSILVERSLEFGPNQLDLGVFVAARQLGAAFPAGAIAAYELRLRSAPSELQDSLTPIALLLKPETSA
ncbi:hypothetical protein [Vulgatibacter sp.]|uniref:hypothetical protein n=1 Tax=Vulgatibacter sp. TaxID=1971226 RepID=UPI003566FF05